MGSFEPSIELGFEDEGAAETDLLDPTHHRQLALPVRTGVVSDAAVMRVQAGTNCPQGGNHGEGGRTLFRLDDLGSTAIGVRVAFDNGRSIDYDLHTVQSVSIMLGGDSEARMLVAALEFALHTLRLQLERHGVCSFDVEGALDYIAQTGGGRRA